MSDDPKQQISEITQKAFDTIYDRKLTRNEILYLLSRYPFLEICDHENPYLDETIMPEVIIADNGWRIFDYGSAIFTSGNEFASYEHGKKSDDEEGGGGHGTIVQQYTDIAFLVIDRVKKKSWQGIDILTGYYPMLRMAWIAAKLAQLETYHFVASAEDYVVYNWVSKMKKGDFYPTEIPFISPSKGR